VIPAKKKNSINSLIYLADTFLLETKAVTGHGIFSANPQWAKTPKTV